MNKFLMAGLLALGVVLTSQQQASAWCKWSFNAGVSLNYEGGNNTWFWGAFNGGQYPGYPTDVLQGRCGGPAPAFNGYGGYPAYAYGGYPAMGDHHAAAPTTAPAATSAPAPQGPTQAVYYNNYNYQPQSYYPANNYYQYPSYGYGNYQVPSYWYGN